MEDIITMKKYLAHTWRGYITPKIKEVEIEKETPASVWINGRRYQKYSEYEKYYDSFLEAYTFLVKEQERWIKK